YFFKIISVVSPFNFQNDLTHGLHHESGMKSRCCFTTQHHRICAFQHRVSNIGDLASIWFDAIDHALHHLRGYDHGLRTVNALANDLLLNVRNFLHRQFHAEVATCDHDAIRFDDDVADVCQRFGFLNLGNDLRHAVPGVEDRPQPYDVINLADK